MEGPGWPAGNRPTPGTGPKQPGNGSWPSPPDPGDLSRRVALRRAELKLSIEQVAVRAQMSPRYVKYLERYPARISADGLRRLAAALQTSPPALLEGGLAIPPGRGRPAVRRTLACLTRAECHQLIAPEGIGGVAFRTAPAGVIAAQADGSQSVTFEVDHVDEALRQGWSVVIQGIACRITGPAELSAAAQDVAVWPWPWAGGRDAYIRIFPHRISGRRITPLAS